MKSNIEIAEEHCTKEWISHLQNKLENGEENFDEYETAYIVKHRKELLAPTQTKSKKKIDITSKLKELKSKQSNPLKAALTAGSVALTLAGTLTPAMLSYFSTAEISIISTGSALALGALTAVTAWALNKTEQKKLEKFLKDKNIKMDKKNKSYVCGELNRNKALRESEVFRMYGAGI